MSIAVCAASKLTKAHTILGRAEYFHRGLYGRQVQDLSEETPQDHCQQRYPPMNDEKQLVYISPSVIPGFALSGSYDPNTDAYSGSVYISEPIVIMSRAEYERLTANHFVGANKKEQR